MKAKYKFSKTNFLNRLAAQIATMERLYNFTSSNGWAQVNHKGEEINRLYGQYTTLVDLHEEIQTDSPYTY